MIHTSRTVTVGKMESIINEPIVLYRGDREVEVEFVLNGSKFMFTNGGNVIKSTNAALGQLVVNTPTGENMFSEITECHDGKVVFVITKEMIDELVEVGFYSFQIRLFDDTQVSRVTIPPVHQGIDIRNPIATEDETDLVDIGLVDYSVVRKDDYENVVTFLPNGDYNKTLWEEHDVISRDRLNKVEDALYEINKSTENLYPTLQNQYDEFSAEINKDVKAYKEEMEDEVEQFERDMTQAFGEFKVDVEADLEGLHAKDEELSEQLATNTQHIAGGLNIKSYEHLVINDDWTDAIHQAIEDCHRGGTIFFPEGTYKHQGIRIKAKYINFVGSGRFGSFLVNVKVDGDAITLENSAERGTFRDIAIYGNGSLIYGSDATSGNGIVFSNNSVSYNFENVTVRGHGGDGFKGGHLGHVNNINIVNSEIEFNKGNGISFNYGKGQINAIFINGCNISNNGLSGVCVFGNAITIENNTVQGNRKYGFEVNHSNTTMDTDCYCRSVNVINNYTEKNLLGIMFVRALKGDGFNKNIVGLNFSHNYSTEKNLDDSVTHLIDISVDNYTWYYIETFKKFTFIDNHIDTKSGVKILNGNNVLCKDSMISVPYRSHVENIGNAKLETRRNILTLNNIFSKNNNNISIDFKNGKTGNITSNTDFYYNIPREKMFQIYQVTLNVDTDMTNARIDVILMSRDSSTTDDYTTVQTIYLSPINNGSNVSITSTNAFIPLEHDDVLMKLKVYTSSGSTLYMYNPMITFF